MKVSFLKSHRTALLVGSLLLAGALVRIYAAWCFRHNMNLDAGIVALMAKHIAEGREIPVFFYGQAHMGSLEPLFGGLFCRLFGVSGFAVCLGTAFTSFWLLPVVYCWARDAAGRFAGIAALAFVVIGPGGFFHYNGTPRLYAVQLTLSAFLLWYATRMATRWATERRQSGFDFLLLGIAAGLAWWSSQLTTAAILTAALLLLVILRQALFSWRLVPGVVGFLAGSAPFWIYNVRNDWASFAFAGTFGRIKLSDGLRWFFTDRFMSLMTPWYGPDGLRVTVVMLYILLVLGGLLILYRALRAGTTSLWVSLLGILLFTALFSLIYASSHFAAIATPRYFLPMVPPLAVLLGIVVARLAQRVPPAIAVLPLIFLVALQWPALRWAYGFEQDERMQLERVKELADVLEEKEIEILYASQIRRAWNFALRERFAFVDAVREPYRPNAQRAESAEEIAVLENYGGIEGWLRTTNGRAQQTSGGGYRVFYNFEPPPRGESELPAEQWRSAIDSLGRDVKELLSDGRVHTEWRAPEGTDGSLTMAFNSPVAVSGVRVLALHPQAYPGSWSLYGETEEGEWVVLHSEEPFTRWFWSGSRPFWGGPFYRLEARFNPVPLTRLRLVCHAGEGDPVARFHTVQVFTPSTSPPRAEEASISLLLDKLKKRKINRLYADRWEANRVDRETGGQIRTSLDPAIFPERPALVPETVLVSDRTALLAHRRDADLTRRVLESRGALREEIDIDPWVVFLGWSGSELRDIALRWAGFAPLRDDGALWAGILYREAARRVEEGRYDEKTLDRLDRALTYNPHHYEARRMRLDLLQRMDRKAEAAAASAEWAERFNPHYPTSIHYPNGVEFLGYRLAPDTVASGGTFRITYYWKCPPDVDTHQLAVFVHFRRDGILFQDDHVFMDHLHPSLLSAQPSPPVIAVEREIQVPAEIAPGPVDIVLGVYDRRTGTRLRARTDLPARRHAVTLPTELTLTK